MSSVTISGNPSGSGTFTVQSPNSNTSRTITLPDATTTLVGTDATQTLTNKTIQGGALTLGTAQASTSGTAIDFTGIPSWAKRVTVMFNTVSLSGSASILVQLGSGTVSASGYASSSVYFTTGTASASGAGSTTGLIVQMNLATRAVTGSMIISNIVATTWAAQHSATINGTGEAVTGGGGVTLSGALDRVRITSTNGTDTFDAGTINIMYEG